MQVVLGPGDMLDVPQGMQHYAETVGNETVTFVERPLCGAWSLHPVFDFHLFPPKLVLR